MVTDYSTFIDYLSALCFATLHSVVGTRDYQYQQVSRAAF